jgi:hypothetical protein
MTNLAKETHQNFEKAKELHGAVSLDDILGQIHKLQDEVKKIKQEGISVWSAQKQIPKVFDIVDGAFEIMIELVENQKDKGEK